MSVTPPQVEVECTSEQDAREACTAGADVIMLDNYTGPELKKVAANIKKEWPHVIIEARPRRLRRPHRPCRNGAAAAAASASASPFPSSTRDCPRLPEIDAAAVRM